jgi:GDPmannose 4,6-dehydratase
VVETPQTESTPFRPLSPYANAKAYAFWATSNTREAYGLFAVNGILFNHESPERSTFKAVIKCQWTKLTSGDVNFVTRKITTGVAQIACGGRQTIRLGNLDAERDWSHAKDFMHGVYMMMQYPKPGDYILASGIKHSVREFAEHAFKEIGVNLM